MMIRFFAILTVILFWIWGSMAIFFAGPALLILKIGILVVFIITPLVIVYYNKLTWRAFAYICIAFLALTVWWQMLIPVNDKIWASDVANIPYGSIEGSILTLHNVRNFKYQTETDFTERWETRTYDLSQLESLDLFMSYWGSPHIAHTILSWGFSNGDHLAVSIETRKDKHQEYSALKGFFKQYTLVYVAADEQDLIRLRTNFRDEQVYIYRLQVPNQRLRQFLTSYVAHMNRLKKTPEFYNALTMNCTSTIRLHSETSPDRLPSDWRLVANGHLDKMLYEYAKISQDLPFEKLRVQSRIDLAMKKLDAANFSSRLREAAKIK